VLVFLFSPFESSSFRIARFSKLSSLFFSGIANSEITGVANPRWNHAARPIRKESHRRGGMQAFGLQFLNLILSPGDYQLVILHSLWILRKHLLVMVFLKQFHVLPQREIRPNCHLLLRTAYNYVWPCLPYRYSNSQHLPVPYCTLYRAVVAGETYAFQRPR